MLEHGGSLGSTGGALDMGNVKVCSCDEGEQHGQTEECGGEKGVDADSADKEGERHKHHDHVVEALR